MNEHWIGRWVTRFHNGVERVSRAHLVESIIEERAVMKCGRQMEETTERGSLQTLRAANHACRQCV